MLFSELQTMVADMAADGVPGTTSVSVQLIAGGVMQLCPDYIYEAGSTESAVAAGVTTKTPVTPPTVQIIQSA